MRLDNLPDLDDEIWYDPQEKDVIIYYKSNKKRWQFWKKSHVKKHLAEFSQVTTSQATYEWINHMGFVKISKQCRYCGQEIIIGTTCSMCTSLAREKNGL